MGHALPWLRTPKYHALWGRARKKKKKKRPIGRRRLVLTLLFDPLSSTHSMPPSLFLRNVGQRRTSPPPPPPRPKMDLLAFGRIGGERSYNIHALLAPTRGSRDTFFSRPFQKWGKKGVVYYTFYVAAFRFSSPFYAQVPMTHPMYLAVSLARSHSEIGFFLEKHCRSSLVRRGKMRNLFRKLNRTLSTANMRAASTRTIMARKKKMRKEISFFSPCFFCVRRVQYVGGPTLQRGFVRERERSLFAVSPEAPPPPPPPRPSPPPPPPLLRLTIILS